MTKLVWNQPGDRTYETGVDRGVLYVSNQAGVAWNGLVSVTETPSGAEASSQYAGNNKYLTLRSAEEFGGTIEAFTYPEEFEACDGTANINGVSVHQQNRESFAFSYRTLIGNDIVGKSYGYKIHLVFDAQATPSEVAYSSTDDQPEALTFSWDFTTTPVSYNRVVDPSHPLNERLSSLGSYSHISIDSRKIKPVTMRLIEEVLYGTGSTPPRMLDIEELFKLLDNDSSAFNIFPNYVTGFSPIIDLGRSEGDLIGSYNDGIYSAPPETTLRTTKIDGVLTME